MLKRGIALPLDWSGGKTLGYARIVSWIASQHGRDRWLAGMDALVEERSQPRRELCKRGMY